MSDNVILAQQTIEGFAEVEEGAGIYGVEQEQALSLTAGETYTVLWDGTEYSCIAVSEDGVALGNLSLAGISDVDSGEPFLIGCVPAALTGATDMLIIYTTDAAESHAVAIAVEGIVTFNRYGDKEYHYGIQTLTLDTTTAKHQRVHTKGVKAEKSVALDMADGDLIIEPDPGTLLGKVTIEKPETMIPENIRSGAEIGGVQGSFIGDTEEITVDLNMAEGDQVIVPSADGKVISKVTVMKPETLAPENIAEGATIAGIPGTHVGGGGTDKSIAYSYDDSGNIVGATPYGFTELPAYAFAGITTLEWVDWSQSPDLSRIRDHAFYKCTALASITIPDGVTEIGAYAFYECLALTSVGIPNSVITIGEYAFYKCTALASITIPDGVTSIERNLFYECTALTSITIPDNVTGIGSYAFKNCTGLTSVSIGSGVEYIAVLAFDGCSNVTSVTFWDTTTWTVTAGSTTKTVDVRVASTAATLLTSTYSTYTWKKT